MEEATGSGPAAITWYTHRWGPRTPWCPHSLLHPAVPQPGQRGRLVCSTASLGGGDSSSCREQQQILAQERSRNSYPHLWSHRGVLYLLCLTLLYNVWFLFFKYMVYKWRGRRMESKYIEVFLRGFEDLWRDLKHQAFVLAHRHKSWCCLKLRRRCKWSCISLVEGRTLSWKLLSTGCFCGRRTVMYCNVSWIIQ